MTRTSGCWKRSPASAKAGPHQNNHLDEKLRASIPAWSEFSKQLAARRRAALAQVGGLKYWVSAERAKDFVQVFPAACFEPLLPDLESKAASREDVLLALTAGWMAHCGPLTANALGETLETPVADIERTLLRMEASGAVLRGRFTDSAAGETEWCDRRLLARIHRLTLGTLRKQIAPVTPAEFLRWLFRWQHVAPGTQLLAERGTLEALRQLQAEVVRTIHHSNQLLPVPLVQAIVLCDTPYLLDKMLPVYIRVPM